LLGEQLGRLLLQRVRVVLGLGRAVRRNLGTADDHHEEFVRTDQRNCGPRGHHRTGQVMTQAVRDVGREGRRDTQAHKPPRQRGNRHLAESSITMELA
jgi:hypothetical protein